MLITSQTLADLYACRDQINLFEATFPEGTEITSASIQIAMDAGLAVAWFMCKYPILFKDHRHVVLQCPMLTFYYAFHVDKAPMDDTRAGACKDPAWAYQYAFYVDKTPRTDTRKSACARPAYAYYYAHNVDRGPHDDTRAGVCKDPVWAEVYERDINTLP